MEADFSGLANVGREVDRATTDGGVLVTPVQVDPVSPWSFSLFSP